MCPFIVMRFDRCWSVNTNRIPQTFNMCVAYSTTIFLSNAHANVSAVSNGNKQLSVGVKQKKKQKNEKNHQNKNFKLSKFYVLDIGH